MEPQFGPQFDQINLGTAEYIQIHYDPNSGVKDRFIKWWTSFAEYANNNPFDMMYMDQMATSHLYAKFGEQASTRFYDETRNIIKDGQAQGLIKPMAPSLINQFVRCALTNVLKLNMIAGKSLDKTQIETIVGCCWDGISTK